MSQEENRSREGQRVHRRAQSRELRLDAWGGEGRAQLTVVHQCQGDLVFGFSVLELSRVRPFVVLGQFLDDHFHQALLSVKVDFAVLGRTNPENHCCSFLIPGNLHCEAPTGVLLHLGVICAELEAFRDGEGTLDNPLLLIELGSPHTQSPKAHQRSKRHP